MRAYKFGQKWEIGQKSPASTCLGKTDAANPIKPFKTSSNQRFRKFWSLLLRMPEAGSFAIRVALAVVLNTLGGSQLPSGGPLLPRLLPHYCP